MIVSGNKMIGSVNKMILLFHNDSFRFLADNVIVPVDKIVYLLSITIYIFFKWKHDRVDNIISTVIKDINVEKGDDEVLKQREENLNKDKGKKMVSQDQDPPVEKEKEKVVRTTKKIVEAMCSPYNVRAVNLKGKLNKEEREIMYWLMKDEESEQ